VALAGALLLSSVFSFPSDDRRGICLRQVPLPAAIVIYADISDLADCCLAVNANILEPPATRMRSAITPTRHII